MLAGVAVGKLLEVILSAGVQRIYKTILVMALGLGIFVAAFEVTEITYEAGFELHLEPLLISMIAGFFVTNFTNYRDQFDEILHDISPLVYVAFFTLTGVALKLDILLATGGIAFALFLTRMFSIFIGSYAGGTLAGEPERFKRIAWMGLITQAGIALGLAREVSVEFPSLGDAFATLIISVVVLNEIFGPLFLKNALRRAGEAHEPEGVIPDEHRDAVIFGVEGQSMALARQLKSQGWGVRLADTRTDHIVDFNGNQDHFEIHHIEAINEDTLGELITGNTDAVVAMLDDDGANLAALNFAQEKYAINRLVVRLNEMSRSIEFASIGAMIVNPTAAMVSLLDQAVRAPQSTALLTHQDPDYDITQVTITNPDINGMLVRDLRLPGDVLILEIARNGRSIVPNGYSAIRLRDEITFVGSPESLREVTVRMGY